MKKEFKILSLKEEDLLSTEEKKKYYVELRKYIEKRKLTNTTPGATTIAPKLKKPTNKIADMVTKAFTSKNVEWVYDGVENIPEGPVIFAFTHQGLLDNFVWIPQTDKHSLILHSIDTNKLLLLCQVNTGLVLVKKGDKENSKNAKLDMIRILREGHSITYFPESAWNLSPNKLHLPMSYGFLDTAKKAGVPVIPGVIEYTYDSSSSKEKITKIHTRYAKPMYVGIDDNLSDKLQEYEGVISTIRYELIEEKGEFSRSEISAFEYKNYLDGCLKNLKLGSIDINNERKNLFNSQDEFYKFHHINDVPCDEFGVLLETDEVRKIKKYNSIHNN